MAEQNNAAKAAAALRAMDHHLAAQRSAKPGEWFPSVEEQVAAATEVAGAPVVVLDVKPNPIPTQPVDAK